MVALPALSALEECADFSKTVEPFLPQLYALPENLGQVLAGRQSLSALYVETNPLISGFAISIILGAVFLVAAEVNRNYSQVDRFWSLLPTFYIAHFDLWARLAGVPSKRVDAALLFSTIWSIRLTFNYWRKGGYNIGSEDYRWEIIRQYVPKFVFHVFNWTFISFIQSVLLYALAVPVYTLLLSTQFEPNLTSADFAYLAVELGLVLTEWFADQQQWDFHGAKDHFKAHGKVAQGYTQKEIDRGFITRGLWGYSRHPNFAAEQSIWFFLYQWSCFASRSLYSWTAAGPSFLVLLFQGSTWLTELITSGKYPDYRDYQSKVGMFVPTSFSPYKASAAQPKVIRTSELAKKLEQKQKQK
ncbi:hypothetical protein QBC37DRAFT_413654 [Rhypophila decipiens]|uniref:DUF1295 domain-containing protein n=1 Tax=Rhypophila decipiens TaxID=261697 RepID=A0AAN6YHV8_9PEZI|nr:hypothetical protein QBC37DRAFT_413654 [Rhypophila decipiens]